MTLEQLRAKVRALRPLVVAPVAGYYVFEQLRAPAPDIEGPHRPLIRGEIGQIDGRIRIVTSRE